MASTVHCGAPRRLTPAWLVFRTATGRPSLSGWSVRSDSPGWQAPSRGLTTRGTLEDLCSGHAPRGHSYDKFRPKEFGIEPAVSPSASRTRGFSWSLLSARRSWEQVDNLPYIGRH